MATVLVVDDEDSVRELVIAMIEPLGYDIVEATNGEEASAACKATTLDLIITDIVMPDKNGIDFIMEVKKEYPDVPVIAISGGGGIAGRYDYLKIAKLVGAHNILKKPFDAKELRTAVSEAIENCTPSN